MIKPSRFAFMSGRYVTEGVVTLHETLHEIQRKKLNGVVLKLDFKKAYDKVNWSFLQQTLKMKGFSPKWCRWIESIVSGEVWESKLTIVLGISSKQRRV